ncbi:MAG: DegT/DnrJ/EryC1/StrS family aminotransferase [Fimbriimonadaceae bacterium]|nr:DegT/DnrJ/EryC1/StrS family aminotransferase [Fimbriimonadaceae bacterium]
MAWEIPFLDLRVQDATQRGELLAAVDRVLQHGRLIDGPETVELAAAIAARAGRAQGVGVGSGSDALYYGVRALDLPAGSEVILPCLSMAASAACLVRNHLQPVYADVLDDLTIDPASVARLITPATRALLLVHYTGRCCELAPLQALCREHGLALIEDVAQAFGASYHGQPAGSFGEVACFSFNNMKILAALGEAGCVVGDRPGLSERLRQLRHNGIAPDGLCVEASGNGRLDTLQAALLLCRLRWVDALIARRQAIARRYNAQLADVVSVPPITADRSDVFYVYSLRTPRREALRAALEAVGIEPKLRDPVLLPQQPAFAATARGEWTRAAALNATTLCLPAHEGLRDDQVDHVAATVRRFYGA